MVAISLEDPAVQTYMFYSGLLGLKMFVVAFLTSRQRNRKKVVANKEDAKAMNGKIKFDDPDVERVRRAHRNDLENIPAFWVLGALYLTTGPSAFLATNLFRIYAVGRVLRTHVLRVHTIVYAVKPQPQPARGICFGVPFIIAIYMGVKVIQYYAGVF